MTDEDDDLEMNERQRRVLEGATDESSQTVTIEVETTEPFLKYLETVKSDSLTWSEFFLTAAQFFATQTRETFGETSEAVVDVPEEAAERARLRAEDKAIQHGGSVEEHFTGFLHEEVNLVFDYPENAPLESEGEGEE